MVSQSGAQLQWPYTTRAKGGFAAPHGAANVSVRLSQDNGTDCRSSDTVSTSRLRQGQSGGDLHADGNNFIVLKLGKGGSFTGDKLPLI